MSDTPIYDQLIGERLIDPAKLAEEIRVELEGMMPPVDPPTVEIVMPPVDPSTVEIAIVSPSLAPSQHRDQRGRWTKSPGSPEPG